MQKGFEQLKVDKKYWEPITLLSKSNTIEEFTIKTDKHLFKGPPLEIYY